MKKTFFLMIAIILFSGISLLAMDSQLWNVPIPAGAVILRKDSPIEVCGISAQSTRMRTDMAVEQVFDFYRDVFSKTGWQTKDYFQECGVIAFIKENNYMYVWVRDNGKRIGRDVYLISSPADLAVCRMTAAKMDNSGIMLSDTGGKDFTDLPRYPTSKRMLSFFAGQEANIAMYQAQGNVQQISRFFRDNLKAAGWKLTHSLDQNSKDFKKLLSADVKPEDAQFANLNFQKGNEELIVAINAYDKSQNLNLISIIRNDISASGSVQMGR